MAYYPPEYLYKVEYTTEGATDLTVSFPYLLKDHVFVVYEAAGTPEGEGVILTVGVDWVWLDAYTIQLVTPIAAGETITIQRQTRIDMRMVDYANGAQLGEEDLNIVTKQLLYLIQEITEARVEIPGLGGGGGGGGGVLTDAEIDQIIDELLATQLFLDLVELIPLMDINAELIIANQLKNHRDWLIEGEFDFRLNENGTLIQTVQNQHLGLDEAFATYQLTIAARFGDSEGSIIQLMDTRVTQTTAYAGLITELQARVPYADLENQISLSSYINGVKTTADENVAEINTITSALVGVGGDFQNPEETSILGIFQETLDIQAGQITQAAIERAGLEDAIDPGTPGSLGHWRQTMSAFFNVDPTSGESFASAIQNQWITYADTESAAAIKVATLEANTQPLFFRDFDEPPLTSDPEFNDTTWNINGFPEGSMWYQVYPGNATVPYIYLNQVSSPGDDAISAGTGWWIPATDTQLEAAMGAKVQELVDVVVGPGGTAAELENRIQTVWGGAIASLSEVATAYLQPPSEDGLIQPGIAYTSWNVRANLSLGNDEPVVAGFGLGIQADPFNINSTARSDFIVMADWFSVVAPPTVGTILDGVLDHNTVKVPFIIDTQSGEVIINGNLFVRGTLRAYEGGLYDVNVGQVQAGQMDSNVELVDPLGIRVGLYSSTFNFWESNTASPFPGGSNPQKFLIWSGTGIKNHNNAIFYVDTDGNGFFSGQVSADNIDGDLSTLTSLSVFGTEKTANSTTNPVWLTNGGGQSVFAVGGSNTRGRKPYAIVNVDLHGAGANVGAARMEMRLETAPGVFGAWQTVSEFPLATPTGSTLTLAGGINSTTSYGAQVRVGILRFTGDGAACKSNGYQGIFVMTA